MQIALANRDLILQRLASGDLVHKIAQDLGCNRKTITRTLKDDPDYQDAQSEALDARLERVETEMDELYASDGNVPLARVSLINSRLTQARWRCERLNPSKYGQVRPQAAPTSVNVQVINSIERRIVRADQIDRPQPPHLENGVEDAE